MRKQIEQARAALECCQSCGGSGFGGRNFVTADMASDAGEPEMAGMELAPDWCGECYGAGVIENEHVAALISAVRADTLRELLADAERDLAVYVKDTGNVHPTRTDSDLFAFVREFKRRIASAQEKA